MLTNQVVRHECHLQLVVVLVVNLPQGIILRVVVFPEPWHGNGAGVLVGVLALPVIKDHCWLGESLKRVLGLGSWLLLLLSRGSGSGSSNFGGRSWLGSLFLFWWDILQWLLDERRLRNNSLENGLVDNGFIPSSSGRVRKAPLLAEDILESAVAETGSEEISQSYTLTNKESVTGKVLLKDIECFQSTGRGFLNSLLVVGFLAKDWAEPGTDVWNNFRVGKAHPAKDGGIVLLGLSEKGSLLVLGSNYKSLVEVYSK